MHIHAHRCREQISGSSLGVITQMPSTLHLRQGFLLAETIMSGLEWARLMSQRVQGSSCFYLLSSEITNSYHGIQILNMTSED